MKFYWLCLLIRAGLFAATTLIVDIPGDRNQPVGFFQNGRGDLRGCLNFITESEDRDFEILFQLSNPLIDLEDALQVGDYRQSRNIRIDGSNWGMPVTINGQNKTRAFFLNDGNVTVENLHIKNGLARGAANSGGGLGAGGALFVYKSAHLTLKNVAISNCKAVGAGGGFGGPGIGGSYANLSNGGAGGFGGGGGAGPAGVPGVGGIGGGQGSLCAGGGGAGMGGAIFVMQEDGLAGSLHLQGNITVQNCGVVGGDGGCLTATAGAGAGSDLFLMHGTSFSCSPSLSEIVILNGIADDSPTSLPPGNSYTPGSSPGASMEIAGDGEVVLRGKNTYSGQTYLRKGTLTVAGSLAGPIRVGSFGTLQGEGAIGGQAVVEGTVTGNLQINSALFDSYAILQIDLRGNKPSKLTVVEGVRFKPGALLFVIPEAAGEVKKLCVLHSEKGAISGVDNLKIQSADRTVQWTIDPESTDRDLFIKVLE